VVPPGLGESGIRRRPCHDQLPASQRYVRSRARRAVAQVTFTQLRVAPFPAIDTGPGDPVIAAGPRDVVSDFLSMPKDRQAVGRGPQMLLLGQLDLPLFRDARVSDVRHFQN
jgi:hypothetical protein